MTELPWCDMKVAFDANNSDALWGHGDWPEGWELVETDGAGARLVAIFRIEGMIRVEDGITVAETIKRIEG